MSGRNQFLITIKKLCMVIKKLLTYNIATIMFGALFVYMIVTVILYSTSSHVTSYQVTVGPLTKNPVCTALAIREEQIVPAGASGYVEYYAREGMQVRKNGSVYAITNTRKEVKSVELSEEQLEKMRSNMANFSYGFSGSDFYDAYSFKYELQGIILQAAGIMEQGSADSKGEADTDEETGALVGEEVGSMVALGRQSVYTAPEAGIVVYSTDGYESLTTENITEEAFNEKSYKKTDLLTSKEIAAGDPVYKVITSENWTLMVPLTDKLAATLSGRESIKVKFTKDGESQNGSLSIVQIGNQKAARIQLKNGMPRYASDRFLEVELVINTQSGLKIPVSSVVEKEFYTIPRNFLAQGDNGEGKGFIREVDGKSSSVTEFVDAVIYKEVNSKGQEIGWGEEEDTSGYCYVDKETFEEGDVLKKPDSSETYTVKETDKLQGVYGMNKGYAVFRQINILDQNEEYCIVSQGTSYGLQAFDYIVLDGESVKEEEILH
nr:HlyD family efflux transporter periplasmic adaptor subunit [uncultured Blautia sp.]